jgi:hypothetical protein
MTKIAHPTFSWAWLSEGYGGKPFLRLKGKKDNTLKGDYYGKYS